MGFRDRIRGKSQAQGKHKSGSTWSAEINGHRFTFERETHYTPPNNPATSTSARPPLPPRPNTEYPRPPPLPPRSTSQQSAPAVLQHQSEPTVVRQNGSVLPQFVSSLVSMFISPKPHKVKESKKSPDKVWMLSCLMALALFVLVLCYTIVPLSGALAIAGLAYAITAIFQHYLNTQTQRHEITVTAQERVMIAMVEKGHAPPYATALTSGFLESNASGRRLIEY